MTYVSLMKKSLLPKFSALEKVSKTEKKNLKMYDVSLRKNAP